MPGSATDADIRIIGGGAGAPDARSTRRALRYLVAISIVTFALYSATRLLERAMFYGRAVVHTLQVDGYGAHRTLVVLQMAGYLVVTVLIFWAYLSVLKMCKGGELDGRRERYLALGVPVVLNIFCLLWLPRLSQDAFSYVAHGLLGLLPDHNPLLKPVESTLHTAFAPSFTDFGWLSPGITPYGILWTRVEIAVVRFWDGNVYAAVLSFKVIATMASLATARLIWLMLGRTYPDLQLQGTLAYLWNPLIVMELAGEGHNDAVMIFFSMAAIAAAIGLRPALSLVAQSLGIMTKYLPLAFVPAQLCYLWRVRRNGAHLARQLAVAGAVSLAIAILLYAPLWAGTRSFDGIIGRSALTTGSATLAGATRWFLKQSPLKASAVPITTALFAVAMSAWILWSAVRVKDARDLLRSCAWISLAFVLIASPDYWPWYACMPVAWIIVGDFSRLSWLALLMSLLARLVAPLELLRVHEYMPHVVSRGLMTGLGTLVPLFSLVVWFYLARRSTPPAEMAAVLGARGSLPEPR
ncbi:MAG: hypothetical protein JO299_07870 [Gammaproteobacteria bacterium]|nr:hypothetical protein [Gammaproteobacteria bacterium]